MSAVLKRFFSSVYSFCKIKSYYNENISFTDYAFGIRLPECYKLVVNWKNDNDVTIFWHDAIVNFAWRRFVSLVKFSYWSKFYVNIITYSGVMTISFHKGLTRNPEIGNNPVCVLPNIWRLGQVRKTKFGTNVSNKMLMNPAQYQGCSFYRFWVIQEKPKRARWGTTQKIIAKAASSLNTESPSIIVFLFNCPSSLKMKKVLGNFF